MGYESLMSHPRLLLALAVAALAAAAPIHAQQSATSQAASRVSVAFEDASMSDVLGFFSRYSGRSIVAGSGVAGTVTAHIESQPWDEALQALLTANGLYAHELPTGIIVVENPKSMAETPGPTVTRVFRLNFANASELEPAVKAMLSAKGTVATVPSLNALIVTDQVRVVDQVAVLLGK